MTITVNFRGIAITLLSIVWLFLLKKHFEGPKPISGPRIESSTQIDHSKELKSEPSATISATMSPLSRIQGSYTQKLWRPGEYRKLPQLHPGIIALKNKDTVIYGTFETIQITQCTHFERSKCAIFPEGQEIVLTPELQIEFERL